MQINALSLLKFRGTNIIPSQISGNAGKEKKVVAVPAGTNAGKSKTEVIKTEIPETEDLKRLRLEQEENRKKFDILINSPGKFYNP